MIIFIIAFIPPSAFTQNRVLSLDGDGDYVEIEDSETLNNIGSQVTMEAWIKPTSFPNQWISIIFKADEWATGSSNRSYTLWLNRSGSVYLASSPEVQRPIPLHSLSDLIKLNKWYHLAGVIDATNSVMRIFINGVEVATRDFAKKKIHLSKLPLRIGWSSQEEVPLGFFAGQIDDVRIWKIARTQKEIQATMHLTLSGKETGLVGYWRFDDDAVDSSPSHADGKLIGDAHVVEAELPNPSELLIPTVLSGIITAESGSLSQMPRFAWSRMERR